MSTVVLCVSAHKASYRTLSREPWAIVDKQGRIIAVLAGRPRGDDWTELTEELAGLLSKAGSKMTFSRKQRSGGHKRGDFPSVSVGTSFGGGSKVEQCISHDIYLLTEHPTEAHVHGLLWKAKSPHPSQPSRICRSATFNWLCKL